MVNGGQEGGLPQLLLTRLQEGEAARLARPGARGLPHLLRRQHLVETSAPLSEQHLRVPLTHLGDLMTL